MSKKKILGISATALLLVLFYFGLPELAKTMLFYPDAPAANFPRPASDAEAVLQDLEYFEKYVRGYDRSFHFRARGKALSQIAELRSQADSLSLAELELAISEIVALGENGHSNVWSGPRARRHPAMPYYGYWFDDGYYIVAATPEFSDLLGVQVTHIGGTPVEAIRDAFRKYYGGEDSGYLGYNLPYLIQNTAFLLELGFIQDALNPTLTIARENGTTEQIKATAIPPQDDRHSNWPWGWLIPETKDEPQFIRFKNEQNHLPTYIAATEPFQLSQIPEANALYVQYRQNYDGAVSISDFNDQVRAAIAEFQPQVLILDERFNGGGDYTKTADLMFELPGLLPEGARVYAITGHETFSAGISTLGFLKEALQGELTIVGRRIGDSPLSWGETNDFILPNSGIGMTASRGLHDQLNGCEDWIQCYWTDFEYPTAVGSLDPDVPVAFTFADYAAGKDASLAAILELESTKQADE